MPGSLIKTIKKTQLSLILTTSILVYFALCILVSFFNYAINQKRLLSACGIFEIKIQENEAYLRKNLLDSAKINELLEPYLNKLIAYYPPGFTIGFYSRDLHRIVTVVSTDPSFKLDGTSLPANDCARLSWQKRQPISTIIWSKLRHRWILKCDYPVITDGRVIGHIFANITLTKFLSLYFYLGLGLTVIMVLSTSFPLLMSRKTNQKIAENIKQLMTIINTDYSYQFDYQEFAAIAEAQCQTYLNLQQAENDKSEILANFPWGYAIIDNTGTIIDINKNGAAALGKKPKELIGTQVEGWDAVFWTIQNKAPVSQEYSILNQKNGIKKYFYSYCYPIILKSQEIGAMNWFLDITERKQLEENLRNEQERLLITLRSISDGVIATNRNGQIILMNETAEKLTGYKQNEAISEPLEKILYIIDDQTSEPLTYSYLNHPDHKQTIHSKNLILINKELRELSILLEYTLIHSTNDELAGMVLVFRDITEKLKTDKELLKTEKLESLGILAGGIAHDFNNILAAIIANIQLALVKLHKGESVEKYLSDTVEITHRATNLTKQLLTFAKGDTLAKKSTSISQLIQDTASFVLHGSKVKCVFNIEDDLWNADVDQGQISQVIQNLVINAKQAMPKGGIIQISARNVVLESENYRPGQYIKLTIKDHGIGIPKEHLNRIFDPFFTTKKDGTGLGLATSYSIIKKHDGYIEVDSQPNVGTNFHIFLPASISGVKESAATYEVTSTSQDGFRILLMDDEEMILKVVGETLNYYGHHVVQVKDGQEAIDKYRQSLENDQRFDVVIMDLTVPGGMGGQEAIAHLRDIDPNIRAIVSSGYANDPIIAEYERFGFCGVVAKPYKFDELIEMIERVVSKNQLKLELKFSDIH